MSIDDATGTITIYGVTYTAEVFFELSRRARGDRATDIDDLVRTAAAAGTAH